MKKLPTIYLEQKIHRKNKQLLVKFSYHQKLVDLIRSVDGAFWSASLRCWYLKNTEKNLRIIFDLFEGVTKVDASKVSKKHAFKRNLSADEKELMNQFFLFLKGKRYSNSTIHTYTFFIADFVNFHTKIALEDLNNRNVEEFIESVFIERNYSVSSQRQFISAMKIFIVFYPHTKINELQLERPKKSRKLPTVLSQEEILEIIRVTQNIKHRAIIALLYSCGLRISELLNLKLTDFNLERKQLMIRQSKGRKDRYVSLADSFLPLLSNYFYSYKPSIYFVEGKDYGKYSAESVRSFLKKSCERAKIGSRVTPHTLRHSYATHLLENGVDIRYIQSLLGHARPETTMIYTHVKRKDLMEISNPLDVALQKLKNTDNNNDKVLLSRNI